MRKISPSILDVKKENLVNYVQQLIDWGVVNVHYDVMDNIFVPNVALQYKEIKEIKEKCSRHIMDIHLMVKDVFGYYEMYKKLGDILTFHFEAMSQDDLQNLIALAKKDQTKLGLAIKPNTPVEAIIPYLKHLSLLLIMSVEPGFGGQKFIENSYDKVKKLSDYIKQNHLDCIIQIDGGVNDQNIKYCYDAGVNLAVVGSFLVKNFNQEVIKSLIK
ncbi:d-ribulose-5-phosphate 3 epimerase [Metamycoplasma arthritidis]|uniref:Ribulose-phosphate 3-epimerase n=1 Tax=Metamycoplasma arthritidis (strain 158L3-1) TaxID=243272 RepID=B3PN78_META1|nr:ribulose-phosphate 3-epimerase [Metamycoplasma arthritidis]ACF07480.1 ribulose-phosphate 3-epimerase [Metamycoplasma arthritidis 158L3-1]VEU79001.1 d-ribulose-5-phosphate 3 epimerase [Metamycoplasma arthritidis]